MRGLLVRRKANEKSTTVDISLRSTGVNDEIFVARIFGESLQSHLRTMFTPKLYDAIILGGGPAGLSAALALARVRRSVLVLSHNEFRNGGVTAMHNVLSRDGIHPDDFRKISREQIEAYGPGIQFIEGEAMRLRQKMVKDGYSGFEVEDEKSRIWKSKKLILAMGSRDIFPDVEGYKDNWPENM